MTTVTETMGYRSQIVWRYGALLLVGGVYSEHSLCTPTFIGRGWCLQQELAHTSDFPPYTLQILDLEHCDSVEMVCAARQLSLGLGYWHGYYTLSVRM